jgi:hypothetical protein
MKAMKMQERMCNEVSADATMWMLRGATSLGASRRTEKRPVSIFALIDLADHMENMTGYSIGAVFEKYKIKIDGG